MQDNNIFSNIDKSIETLGLGKNMIKSLRYWLNSLNIMNNGKMTIFGQILYEKDLYLENSNSIWILHWNLVKNMQNSTLYYLLFNKFYFNSFTKNELVFGIQKWLEYNNIKRFTEKTLISDCEVLIRLYTSEMGLLRELNLFNNSNRIYNLNITNRSEISDELFLFIILDYIDIFYEKNISTLSISDLQQGKISIQKSLLMSENSFYNKIHILSKLTNGDIKYQESLGIRELYIKNLPNKFDILKKIYD